MTADEKAQEIRGRAAALAPLVVLLTADSLMIGVYEEAGGTEGGSGAEGAKQAARSTLAAIDGHLTYFRALCK